MQHAGKLGRAADRRLFPMQKLVTRRTLVDNLVLFHSSLRCARWWVCGRRGESSDVGRLPVERPEKRRDPVRMMITLELDCVQWSQAMAFHTPIIIIAASQGVRR